MTEYYADIDIINYVFDDPMHKCFETITGKNSIHNPISIKYYKQELEANQYVITILEQGLKFPFKQLPSDYEKNNNKSARDNEKLLWDKIMEWEQENYVQRVTVKPRCVNPLSVSEKLDLNSKKIK